MKRPELRVWIRQGLSKAAWIVAALAIFSGARAWQQQTLIDGIAPELRASPLNGQVLNLGHQRGHPTLVYFWATWCAVCRLEQGAMESLSVELPVISVALRSGLAEEVRAYMAEHQLRIPVINDPDGSIAAAWGVRATPTAFVVDRHGRIRFREVGYTSEWGWRLRMWWAGRDN